MRPSFTLLMDGRARAGEHRVNPAVDVGAYAVTVLAALDAAARAAAHDPAAVLDAHAWLGAAIAADAAAGRFDGWGRSTVVDENVGAPVLERGLFDELHARAGVGAAWPVGNAGVLHVYGYLLSTTPTPYGLKRERWIDGALARAYGLAPDAFVPWASTSTLLERVSAAASRLLRHGAARRTDAPGAAASLALGRAVGDGPWALAYAVDGLLVTTFPVAAPDELLAAWDADPARLRWNAVAPLSPG
jgi:hypothetical protein